MPSSVVRREAPLVAAALFIAFIIWLMAKMSTLESAQLIVPILAENVPSNVEVELNPKTALVVVKFPQSQAKRVVSQNFEIRVDIRQLFAMDPIQWAGVGEPKVHDVVIDADNVHTLNLPQSVQVTGLSVNKIQALARLIARSVPIRTTTVGQTPANHELREPPRAEPAETLVTGSPETLRHLGEPGFEIATEPIGLDGRAQDFIANPGLILPPGVQLVNPNNANIQVVVGVREKEASRVVRDAPIEMYVFTSGMRAVVSPPTANVTIKGKVSLIERVDPLMFKFSTRAPLEETPGSPKPVDLDAAFGDDAPEEIRTNVIIEDFTPKRARVFFEPIPESKREPESGAAPAAEPENQKTTERKAESK